MTRSIFCLDTNVVIFAINRRKPGIAEKLDAELRAGTRMIVPAIVVFELEYGVAKSDRHGKARAILDGFLSAGFEHPAFDVEDAGEAGRIRAALESRGVPIGPYDLLIAAQAKRRGATLVTSNVSEFERVSGLRVVDWGT